MAENIKEPIKRILEKVKNMRESTKYECLKCRTPLTDEEIKFALQDLNKTGLCEQCRLVESKEKRKKRLEYLRENITRELSLRGVPPRYLCCDFDNFDTSEGRGKYLKIAKGFVEEVSEDEGLFFTGPNGTGKTHLAVSILREMILSGVTDSYFIKVPRLLFRIRSAIQTGYSAEEAVIDKFVGYEFLVLDELGIEKTTDWSLQTLYLIIDGRNGNLSQTVITSNLDLDKIKEHLDSRFSSRITEMCRSIRFSCSDWRLVARKRQLDNKRV